MYVLSDKMWGIVSVSVSVSVTEKLHDVHDYEGCLSRILYCVYEKNIMKY